MVKAWKKVLYILFGAAMFSVTVALSWNFFELCYETLNLSFDWKITEESLLYASEVLTWLYLFIVGSITAYPMAPFFLFGTLFLREKRNALLASNAKYTFTENRKAKTIMIIGIAVLSGPILLIWLYRFVSHIDGILMGISINNAIGGNNSLNFFSLNFFSILFESFYVGECILFLLCSVCAVFGPLFFYYRSQIKATCKSNR